MIIPVSFYSYFSDLLISSETSDAILQLMVERLSQLDWASDRTMVDVDNIAGAVAKYFQEEVNNIGIKHDFPFINIRYGSVENC